MVPVVLAGAAARFRLRMRHPATPTNRQSSRKNTPPRPQDAAARASVFADFRRRYTIPVGRQNGNDNGDGDNGESSPLPDWLEAEDGEFIDARLDEAQQRRHDQLWSIHNRLEKSLQTLHSLAEEALLTGKLGELEKEYMARILEDMDFPDYPTQIGELSKEGEGRPAEVDAEALNREIDERLKEMSRKVNLKKSLDRAEKEYQAAIPTAKFLPAELTGLDAGKPDADATKKQLEFLLEADKAVDPHGDVSGVGPSSSGSSNPLDDVTPGGKAGGQSTSASEGPVDTTSNDSVEPPKFESETETDVKTEAAGQSEQAILSALEEETGETTKLQDLQLEIQEMETLLEDLEAEFEELSSPGQIPLEVFNQMASALRSQIEEADILLHELEEDLDAIPISDLSLQAASDAEIEAKLNNEEIEYRLVEESTTPPQPSDGAPWYLQSALQPAPRRFVSPLIEQMPPLPHNPPEDLEPLLNYLLKDLSLSKLKIMDLRGLDPAPALGPNVIMILATARSERHMHIAADKSCRFLRAILHGTEIYADGLVGTGQMKLRERRDRRKGKRRTTEDDDSMRVGWICINSGQGIVVQVMTGSKREELNLEGLWSRKINTSQKRKLRDRLAAEGLSSEEIKERVAAEIPTDLESAPEFNPDEVVDDPKTYEPRTARVMEVLPPPELGSRAGLRRFNGSLKASEIHSKSKKKAEGRRYIEIPNYKPNRASEKKKEKLEKQERAAAVKKPIVLHRPRPSVTFSTRNAFSTIARQYSTAVDVSPVATSSPPPPPPPPLDPSQEHSLDLEAEELAKAGHYEKLLKLYPRPRTNSQTNLILIAHLNHLVLTPPEIARQTLVLPYPADKMFTIPFFLSFERSMPQRPTTTHNHLKLLLYIAAHQISPVAFPLNRYVRLFSAIRESGFQVSLESFHLVLRAIATSHVLRGDHPVTMKFWTTRTTHTLAIITAYILRPMDIAGIDVGHDPEVFESLWLALAPRDTREYITALGNPTVRSPPKDYKQPFSRSLDHRASLYKEFHMRWFDPFRFEPLENDHLRAPPLESATVNQLLHPSLVSQQRHVVGERYATLPSYLVTMFVTIARWEQWRRLMSLWRWLTSRGLQRPMALYALYFELLAREATVDCVITELRILLTDLELEFPGEDIDPVDGVAENLLACVDFIEREVPGTGQEFRQWKRRCEKFLGRGEEEPVDEEYTYVI
ncbi:hypothetical protein DRE_00817 [Drechslerella stenobrocha 248]|uniref:ATPase synthesis protein 25 n=1 Tax=Drechslerella stenobrocha 248 TaxID=1043628 RepID=W7HZQ2_9PEZI|nr:hypothetical protein DRE_00817 [Drechslerella stenobrocha 248]